MRLHTYDYSKTHKQEVRVSFVDFLLEFINFVISVVIAFFAASTIVWADTISSFGSTSNALMLFVISKIVQKETGDRFNFGIERLENFVSFLSNILVSFSLVFLLFVSINGISNPNQPETELGLFLLLKIFNISGCALFWYERKKIHETNKTRLTETELATALESLIYDIVIGIVACFCYFFRAYKWSWYISPIASILVCLYFIGGCAKRIKESFKELVDVSTSVTNQDRILDIILENRGLISQIENINCRLMNGKLYIQLMLSFADDAIYRDIILEKKKIEKAILSEYPESSIQIVIEERK